MDPPLRYLPPQKITKEIIKLINEPVKKLFRRPLFISSLLSSLSLLIARSGRACISPRIFQSQSPTPSSNPDTPRHKSAPLIPIPPPKSNLAPSSSPQFVDHWAGRFGRGDRVSRGALGAELGIFVWQLGRGARSFCGSLDFRSEVVGSVVAGRLFSPEGIGFFAGGRRSRAL